MAKAGVNARAHAKARPPSTQIGPELPVSDPVYVEAAPWQSDAQVAFDGTNYLVVWTDYRGYELDADYADVYAARVTPDGIDLDPNGIPIAVKGAWLEGQPAVAFDGTNFLVTWDQGGYPNGDLYGTRVSPQGAVLQTYTFRPGVVQEFALGGRGLVVQLPGGKIEVHSGARVQRFSIPAQGKMLDYAGNILLYRLGGTLRGRFLFSGKDAAVRTAVFGAVETNGLSYALGTRVGSIAWVTLTSLISPPR